MKENLNKPSEDCLIHKLPMSVANQIAAGEVVERPAAALKEMMENALDAGATELKILLKDAGRTLIQVIDNGQGMSAPDARAAFERHATSKIEQIEDLQHILSFGFRGEALASIAAVSQVELKTRREHDDLGIRLDLHGGELKSEAPEHCPLGTSLAVKHLFYNVPARRRFMKSDAVEFKYLHLEFQKLVLCRPEVAFTLWHNDEQVHQLPQTNLRTRIIHVFGKRLEKALVPVETITDAVRVTGFIASPEAARKNSGDQFFFVNGRYFRSPYMQKAVTAAFAQLIPESHFPGFFLFMDVDTRKVDVNIHPTKSEVKFEEDQVIWHILNAAVREALGRFSLIPSIDFDMEGAVEIPALSNEQKEIVEPNIRINPNYDPFEATPSAYRMPPAAPPSPTRWNGILNAKTGFEETDALEGVSEPSAAAPQYRIVPPPAPGEAGTSVLLLKGKYALVPMEDGVWVLDLQRAYYRILYERYLRQHTQSSPECSISLIFPIAWEIDTVEKAMILEQQSEFEAYGFQFTLLDERIQLKAIPSEWTLTDAEQEFKQMLQVFMEDGKEAADRNLLMARTLARSGVRMKSAHWNETEIKTMIAQLFACADPDICPEGKICFWKLTINEIEKRLNL